MKSDVKISVFVKSVLNLFKAVPNLEGEQFQQYILDNEKNLANGFFITERAFKVCPCVANAKILSFIKEKFGYNIFELNQSFYKSFETVANLTPQQILLDRILYYMTTLWREAYGIFDKDCVYLPNKVVNLPENAKPIKVTIIDAIENDEIEARVVKMIKLGAALSEETLSDIVNIVKFLDIELNVDEVANKEFAIRLCELLDILPNEPVMFLRYMVYVVTHSTLLIKDCGTIYNLKRFEKKRVKVEEEEDEFADSSLKKEDIDKLKVAFFDKPTEPTKPEKPVLVSRYDNYFSRYIEKNGIEKLASVFHRFKPLWLAFKVHSDYLRTTINKMRKLADKYHKPMTPRFLERLTSYEEVNLDQLKKELSKITVYRKISLANAILYRNADPESIVYNIRNGKAFVDDYHGNLKYDPQKILEIIIKSIAKDIRPNIQGKKIYIPERFTYAVPVSEKKFIGNIPYGSSYTFESKSGVIGVHWFNIVVRGHEMHIILDFHLNALGLDIGWTNDFSYQNSINAKEHKIIFSGDKVDAPIAGGGATEAYFIGESLTNKTMMFNLNYYNRSGMSFYNPKKNCVFLPPVPFKLFLADVNQDSIDRQYLLDAHEIAFCVPNEINTGEMFLGFLVSNEIGEKKFYFCSRDRGNRIVSRTDDVTLKINSAMYTAAESLMSLNDLLKRAGAVFEGVTAENCDINLDPAEVTKDILLGLFAK